MKELKDVAKCEEKIKDGYFGRVIVIKRSGGNGSVFPIKSKESLFGRDEDCDIRIQLPPGVTTPLPLINFK